MGGRSLLLLISLAACRGPAAAAVPEPAAAPGEHVEREIRGWSVLVDPLLLDGPFEELGREALALLDGQLHAVALVVPPEPLARLRTVPIWLDLAHELESPQYHPSRNWLVAHGHDPRMTRAVHIPRTASFLALTGQQPWIVLHELAHAYHHRELGWEHPPIRQAYDAAAASGTYEHVRHVDGSTVRHYALTDEKEYFAELSEAYFGTNDFYPFVRAELRAHDPRGYALLEGIWGR